MKANSFRPEITLLKYSLWGACIKIQKKKIRAGWVSELLIDLFQRDSGRHPARISSNICILPSWTQPCSSLCKINGWLCHLDLLYHCYILFIHIRFHKLHCFNRNFKLQCNDAKWRNWRFLAIYSAFDFMQEYNNIGYRKKLNTKFHLTCLSTRRCLSPLTQIQATYWL